MLSCFFPGTYIQTAHFRVIEFQVAGSKLDETVYSEVARDVMRDISWGFTFKTMSRQQESRFEACNCVYELQASMITLLISVHMT